jgi:hypothetical protein
VHRRVAARSPFSNGLWKTAGSKWAAAKAAGGCWMRRSRSRCRLARGLESVGTAMGFRRKGKQLHQQRKLWSDWLSQQADLIASSGVPSFVLADEMVWLDFLDHGYVDTHNEVPGFDVDELSSEQKTALLRLISTRPGDLETVVGRSLATNGQ